MEYADFLASKLILAKPSGFNADRNHFPATMYEYQKDMVQWGCKRGKAAFFSMTGTGKTVMEGTWGQQVINHTGGTVLWLAPLAVSKQTVLECAKFGITVHPCRTQSDVKEGALNITNYQMLHHFDPSCFVGIILDESSIIKAFDGKLRNDIIEFSRHINYRLAGTATGSPNDYMELGNHAEFLGVMSYTEMLATFFVHDGGETSKWRLKGHAEERFWEWLATWGVFLTKPSDLGYSDEGFDLPPLRTHHHIVESAPTEGSLFVVEAASLTERRAARKESLERRVAKCADIVGKSRKPFLVWCDLNAESEAITKAIPGAVEVTGSDSDEHKEKSMLAFAAGKIDVMVTKPSICGFGMNWQVCADTAFLGMSDSFEAMFQATKRFHRHGQRNEVNRHIIISEAERSVLSNVRRKENEFETMIQKMVEHTRKLNIANIRALANEKDAYLADKSIIIPSWIQQGGY